MISASRYMPNIQQMANSENIPDRDQKSPAWNTFETEQGSILEYQNMPTLLTYEIEEKLTTATNFRKDVQDIALGKLLVKCEFIRRPPNINKEYLKLKRMKEKQLTVLVLE